MRTFQVPFEGHALAADVIGREPVDLLVLHGAGQSNRERFRQMREHFWGEGITSAAFDCIGHGDTGGDLKHSSLKSRTEQACRVLDTLPLSGSFSILAGSMGGYTAVKLAERYPTTNLILIGPAMYTAEAYAVPFNGGFTEIIRRAKSWEASDAWEILSRFRGRLLVVVGESDAVIPPGVIRGLYESAANAHDRILYVVPNASHMVITDLRAKDPERHAEVMGLMTRMLTARG